MPRFRHPLTEFCAPAKNSAELWRTLLGIVLVIGLVAVMAMVMRIGVQTVMSGWSAAMNPAVAGDTLQEMQRPSSQISFMLTLATFACHWPALWLVLRVLHGRPGRTLWGPAGRINWAHYRIGLGIALGLGALSWLPWLHFAGVEGITSRALSDWLPLLAAGLPLLFVQTASEELMFRGYMLQQFAARSWSIIGWSVAPSLLFAAMHPSYGMPLGINWLSLVFGLVMAAVTSRTANLGAAAGLHFGHNVVNTLIISSAANNHLALLQLPRGMEATAPLLIFLLTMFLGAIIFMGQMDLKFIMAWRADPSRAGQPPVRLVMPIDERWIRMRERRAEARARRKAAKARLKAARAARDERT